MNNRIKEISQLISEPYKYTADPFLYYHRGLEYKRISKFCEAAKDFSAAIDMFENRNCRQRDIDGKDPYNRKIYHKCLIKRGELLINQHNFNEAICDFTKIISQDDKNSLAFYYRSLLREKTDDSFGSENDLRIAKQLNPLFQKVDLEVFTNNPKKFKTGIENRDFINALNDLRLDEDSYWSRIINDRNLFTAIGDEAINIYYKGVRIIKLEYYKNEVTPSILYKYLLQPDLREIVRMENDEFVIKNIEQKFIKSLKDIPLIKKAAKPYSKIEKTGISSFAKSPLFAIDVEISINNDFKKNIYNRIDLATFDKRQGRRDDYGAGDILYELNFEEVKHCSNEAFKTRKVPDVIEQIERYEMSLKLHEDEIHSSYQQVCRNLIDLNLRNWSYIKDIANGAFFEVCCQPKLTIFGFDIDTPNTPIWKRHIAVLREILGERLILLRGSLSFGESLK